MISTLSLKVGVHICEGWVYNASAKYSWVCTGCNSHRHGFMSAETALDNWLKKHISMHLMPLGVVEAV